MRGIDSGQGQLFSYVSLEHVLRIRTDADNRTRVPESDRLLGTCGHPENKSALFNPFFGHLVADSVEKPCQDYVGMTTRT